MQLVHVGITALAALAGARAQLAPAGVPVAPAPYVPPISPTQGPGAAPMAGPAPGAAPPAPAIRPPLAPAPAPLPNCPAVGPFTDACFFTVQPDESVLTYTQDLPGNRTRVTVEVAGRRGDLHEECIFVLKDGHELATEYCEDDGNVMYRAGVR